MSAHTFEIPGRFLLNQCEILMTVFFVKPCCNYNRLSSLIGKDPGTALPTQVRVYMSEE